MRTKVEKRRVRQDSPSAAASLCSGGDGNPVSVLLSPSSLNSDAGDKPEAQRDADRRPVSISEAERLAAANHVVVNLGPPVIVGPSRLIIDGKGDAAGGVVGGGGCGTVLAHSGGLNKSSDMGMLCTNNAIMPEEKAIKKPPKKRRNDKRDVALDLSTSSNLHGSLGTDLHPASSESTVVHMPVSAQLQQPPITPPTPSPQHHMTSSPQHSALHNSALMCRSPPNPTPLLQQTPPSSSEPVMMDTAGDPMELMHSNDVNDVRGSSLEEGSSVTQYIMSDSEVLPVPELDMVLPSSENLHTDVPSLLQQPEAIQTMDAGESEITSATSTSLLQPPTWLLTPQENPPGRESSEHESMAASNLRTAEGTSAPPIVLEAANQPPLSSPKKTSKKVAKNSAAKSKSAKSKTKTESGGKKIKNSEESVANGAVVSESPNNPLTASSMKQTDELHIPVKVKSPCTESTKTVSKLEKPQKKKPMVDDENSKERLAKIEESINSVIARYVYDCEDVSKLNKLRQAAREADAKADLESAKLAEGEKLSAPVKSNDSSVSDLGIQAAESQDSAQTSSETAVTQQPAKPKKKPAAKKKKAESQPSESKAVDNGETKPEKRAPEESPTKPPKKKAKKSKESKATDKTVEDNAKDTSEPTTTLAEAQPDSVSPENPNQSPPKKKKASKKKSASSTDPSQSTPDAISNGHIESASTNNTDKPPKKKASKPKVKKDGQAKEKMENNSEQQNGLSATEAMEISNGLSQPGVEVEVATEKSEAKPKPKKAKKRKSPSVEEETSEKKGGEDEKTDADGETKTDQISKPPSKKKKKKEVKEGDAAAAEPKKKKSPSKSKKAKQLKTDLETSKAEEATLSHNSLPNTEEVDENIENITSESGETKSTEEAGTSTEGGDGKVTTTAAKKVKKTLDEVVCADCGHKTRGQAALSRHMKKMHEKSVVLPYPCPKQPDCEYSASKVSLLARHMLTHRLYMCSRCQFTVDAKDKYEEHLQAEHNVKLDCKLCKKCNRYVKCDTVPLEKHLEECQGPVPFTCDDCGKEFKYESSLKVHHHTHYPDQPKLFNCSQCEYASNYRANLHKHIQNMHVKRSRDIQCLMCDKMFSTEDNMRRHMKIHTQVRPFKCHKCEKAFKSQCALRGHLVSHDVARPYKCNIDNCQREFRTPKFLKSHQEEFHRLIPKKYHCHRCHFSFFKLSHLKRHEISHTGERNFHCSHPGCGKSFRHSDNLKVHLRQHTNERPISCPHCKFTCRQKSSLQWHLKKEHNQSLSASGSENSPSNDLSMPFDDNVPEVATIPEGIPEGLKLAEGFRLPDGVKLPEGMDLAEGEVVELEEVNVIIPATEGEELPVTILELRATDMYEFHSDNDSSDEATPGVFKRDKTKMATSAPLPPPPKELLLKNAVFDVLGDEGAKTEAEGCSKPKKKKPSGKKTTKPKTSTPKEGDAVENAEVGQEKENDEGKKKKTKKLPATKKTNPESKKKAAVSKSKKKAAATKPETTESKDNNTDEKTVVETTEETTAPIEETEAETSTEAKTPAKPKKSPAKKKTPPKAAAKEGEVVEQKEKPIKAPAKGKKSPKTRASPKKPSSPKGKPAKAATRKTPPRKAAAAKKGGKTTAKKVPAKKPAPKKKTAAKKKSPPKKKAAKKVKETEDQTEEIESNTKQETEEQAPVVPEPKPKEKPSPPNRVQTVRRSRETRNSLAAAEDASSPLRPSSPLDSEEENMPQGAGSPYREFDSQDMDDSSSEPRDSPSPPPSPPKVEEPSAPSPMSAEPTGREGDEDTLPQNVDTQEDAEVSDTEDIMMNDIPLTPPRAPAPPPKESSDEEEMIPSPPTHMPMSADTSDTAAPSSVLTDQPGSQAPEFQQPHSREDFQQPHSHQDFQQPHSREEFQQPMSQQPQSVEYPHHHSREEIVQPHSREEYPQHHSREEYPQPHSHSREEYPQPHSREDYSQQQTREDYSQPHSREEYSQPHSREEYSQPHSREEYPQHHSREEYPQHHSREEYPQHHSREEYPQHHSREEYPQPRSREDYSQQHSREELQPQGSVPEPMSEPVRSVHSEGLPDDVSMPHSATQYDPVTAVQTLPTSEAESAYQYLQGLAQSGEAIAEPLTGEPSRLQQLEALAEKPHEDSRNVPNMVKSPVGAAPTSVIASLSPTANNLAISASETSSRRLEILSNDRQVEQALIRDSPSALPRLPEGAYDAYSALNPLAANVARENNNLFPAPPSTPSYISDAVLQRQRMTTPFLPSTQPPERSLSRLPESPLQPPNPSALLRRPATMADGMFPAAPGIPQTMPRNPFTNTWTSQDARPTHWGQAPTYLQRPSNAPTTPFPFSAKDNYQFMFDPTVRPSVAERNMFASLSTTQSQRDLPPEASPFQLDRFDLSTYFGSHPYSGATGLDYSRTAVGATPKTLDERYRQTAASMSEFRPLPPTTSTDMFSGIGVGVNSLNSASFNLDKYAMYGRDPMYHAAAQQLSDNTNSAFLTHAAPTQHSMFDRDYPHRSLYPHQNPAYPLFNDRQYPTAKLTAHPAPSAMGHERDFMTRPTANENQMQDPYRCGMLYNMVNRYHPFE